MKPTDVTTNTARLSYEHLTKPYAANPGQEERYSVTVLVPKTDINTKALIDAAIEAAKQEGVAKKWAGKMPAVVATPVHDGDGMRPNGEAFGPECKGHWVFTANSKVRPETVNVQGQPIIDDTQIYSGMYAYVAVSFFPYDAAGRRGVGCGLNAVMKVKDGEPLGGRVTAAEAFAGKIQTPVKVNPLTGEVIG